MKTKFVGSVLILAGLALVAMPLQAEAQHCSNAKAAGQWAYTYTGSIITQSGPVPAAAVGHYYQDAAGNLSGSQTRTIAGQSAVEDISGNVTVNRDCTATATINVLVNGELQRTAVIAGVYDTNVNHGRDIFQSLTLACRVRRVPRERLPPVLALGSTRIPRTTRTFADLWSLTERRNGKAPL